MIYTGIDNFLLVSLDYFCAHGCIVVSHNITTLIGLTTVKMAELLDVMMLSMLLLIVVPGIIPVNCTGMLSSNAEMFNSHF